MLMPTSNIPIPREVILDQSLRLSDLRVLLIIAESYDHESGASQPGYQYISEQCNVAITSIKVCINRLLRSRWIIKVSNISYTNKKASFKPSWVIEEGIVTTPQSVKEGIATTPQSVKEGIATTPQSVEEGIATTPQSVEEGIATTPQSVDNCSDEEVYINAVTINHLPLTINHNGYGNGNADLNIETFASSATSILKAHGVPEMFFQGERDQQRISTWFSAGFTLEMVRKACSIVVQQNKPPGTYGTSYINSILVTMNSQLKSNSHKSNRVFTIDSYSAEDFEYGKQSAA